MRKYRITGVLALATALLAGGLAASAQESIYERVRSQNAAMAEVQPTWMGPLIQSDSRLTQGLRVSVSDASASGAQIVSYGNNHGVTFLGGRRFLFEFDPPSYFQNHSATQKDGFGNAAAQVKYRIASGNVDHGDFALTAIVSEGFASGAGQNGLLTSYYCPKVAAGKGYKRFNVQSTLGGLLPTGKIAAQGRAVEWNTTAQVHSSTHTWFDVENNAAYFKGGPVDGKTQNFVTPAAFYMVRPRAWEQMRTKVVLGTGMQIATSRYYQYNHNLICDLRVLF